VRLRLTILILGLTLSPTWCDAARLRVCHPLFSQLARESVKIRDSDVPFVAKDFFGFTVDQEKVKGFEGLAVDAQNELLRNELEQLLSDHFGVIPAKERDAFFKLVRQFTEDGGYFLIDRKINPTAHNAEFSVTDKGAFHIEIPYTDLLHSLYGVSPNGREENMRMLVHELRHYVTHQRQVRSRRERGMASPEIYLSGLVDSETDAFALYIGQMEREAKAAERKFTPGVRERNPRGFLYAEAEAIHRRVVGMKLKPEDNLTEKFAADPALIRMADNLASAVIEYYSQFRDGRKLGRSLEHELGGYLCAKKYLVDQNDTDRNFPFEYTTTTGPIYDAFSSIYGRVTHEQRKALEPLLMARMQLRKREITGHLDKILSLHPEIKAWGSK